MDSAVCFVTINPRFEKTAWALAVSYVDLLQTAMLMEQLEQLKDWNQAEIAR